MNTTKCESKVNPFAAGARPPNSRIRHCAILVLAAFSASGPGALAASQSEKEFYDLRTQHDKAVAQAVKPVDDRYLTSLELLAKRATQSGDLDTALMIRNEIEALEANKGDKGSKVIEKPADFAGKNWEWHTSSAGKLDASLATVTLEKDGSISGYSWLKSWEPVKNRQFRITGNRGESWLFEYDPARKEARSIHEKGSAPGDRIMKLIEKHK
jgi:hypothetical protein